MLWARISVAHCEGYKYGKKPGTYPGVIFQRLAMIENLCFVADRF